MTRRCWPLLLATLAATARADDGREVTRIKVRAEERADLVALPPAGEPPTFAVAPITRLVDPATGRPFDPTNERLGFDPQTFRRSFRLESAEVLLGEPVVVEFRSELGDGRWEEYWGGNSRGAPRDDRYRLLMRHRDGAWVADPFAGHDPSHFGGPGGTHTVAGHDPVADWIPLQSWCAIDRPGTYDLYAFRWSASPLKVGLGAAIEAALTPARRDRLYVSGDDGVLYEVKTQAASTDFELELDLDVTRSKVRTASPLADRIPADVPRRCPDAASATEFAHLTLTVRAGTAAERAAMVARWIHPPAIEAKTYQERERREDRDRAAQVAMFLAPQDDFLPEFARRIEAQQQGTDLEGMFYVGLALREDPRVVPLLLAAESPEAIKALKYLRPARRAAAISRLIDLLTDLDHWVRADAEELLRTWTGQSFGHTWVDYHSSRPTPDEGRAMQPLYRDWWERHRATFRP